ncbi:hypothetical protein GCM10011351_04180 [Paraliobacillus quinghaiensis]|uniref:Flagellar protein n=1 Tax=Paraliobacillus quinghaiensis TaxID=470815 RepID=A0A917TFX1_9BACI|nr:flagellar biosynthetic protein FliO [Paraliobacillus quinghaiensis]GGM21452.1 hypothetical protein GCM10011351_04180 [Paraliobacillus quinghaiensis]
MKRLKLIILCLGLVGLFHPASVEAASDNGFVDELYKEDVEENEPIEENGEEEGNNGEAEPGLGKQSSTNPIILFIQIIITLAFIIGLIYILLKFMNKKNKLFKHAGTLENVGGISLGTNKSIQMIRIGERFYVVGVGENIELLSEITDEKTIETLTNDQASEQTNSNQINDVFTQVIPNLLNRKKQPDQMKSPSEFSSLFKKELETLSEKRKKVTAQYKRKDEDKNE